MQCLDTAEIALAQIVQFARTMLSSTASWPSPMPATGFVPASDDAVLPAPRRAASALPVPRALLFFLSHQDSYRRPLFSPHEIFCGPDAETRPAAVNRPAAFRTPVGSFDAGDILASLSAAERPELVIVKADATARNFPRNLARLGCPRVLLVGAVGTPVAHQ